MSRWKSSRIKEQEKMDPINLILAALCMAACFMAFAAAAQDGMTEEQLAAEMTLALQQDQEIATLAAALFEESHYRARVEVRP